MIIVCAAPQSRLLHRHLDIRVLIDLWRTQGVSSVDRGGGRCRDVSLMGELRLVLTGVKTWRWKQPGCHADGDDAGGGRGVPRGPLRCHQMSHGAGGAQSGRCRVGVEVRLAGQVGCRRQVRVNRPVTGTVVREGVWSLRQGRGDVRLLPPVAPGPFCANVLRYLAEVEQLLLEGMTRRPGLAIRG